MSLTNETSRVQYDGPEGTTVFAVPFPFLENSHIRAIHTDADDNDTTLVEGTDYSLAISGSGGTLTLVEALAADEKLTIVRTLPITQPADYVNQDAFPAEAHETSLDRMTMILQQFSRALARAIRFTDTSPEQDALVYANAPTTCWGFDGDGNFVLRTPAEMLEFLSMVGAMTENPVATWATAGDRAAKVPDYTGQVGVQRSDASLWISTGTVAGNWSLYAIHDATMAADSATRPPTQASVLDYVATREAALQDQIDDINSLIGEQGLIESPVGSILPWFSATLPDDTWIFCNGQTLSRTAYAELFLHWGTTFGAGDGSTTFVAPDLRGMFLRGLDNSRGVDASRVLGSYQADQIVQHIHTGIPQLLGDIAAGSLGAYSGYKGVAALHGYSGNATGSGTETRPKNVACNYIAKAVARGSGVGGALWYQDWMFAQDEPMDNVTRFVGYFPMSMVLSHVLICHNVVGSGTPTIQISVGGSNLFTSAQTLNSLTKQVQQASFAAAFSTGAVAALARVEATVAGLPGCAVLSGWTGLRLAFVGRRGL